jgi:hypothetical protein
VHCGMCTSQERLIRECCDADLAQLGLAVPPRPVVPRSLIESGKGTDGKPGGAQQRLHAVQVRIPAGDERSLAGLCVQGLGDRGGLRRKGSRTLREAHSITVPSRATLPYHHATVFAANVSRTELLDGPPVQQVINSLQYNHTPGYYYNVSKSRPFSRIMDTAREALRMALPIKCLEVRG